MTVHVLVNHKYVGHVVVLLATFINYAAASGTHHLLIYNSGPRFMYSQMNGFGPFVEPFVWFKLYWAAWAMLLGVVAMLFWVRGPELGIRQRLATARARITTRTARIGALAVALIIINLLLIIYGPDAQNVQVSYAFDSFAIGPLIIDATKLYAAIGALVVASGQFAFFQYTRLGTSIRACADNYTGALVVGLDVKRLYALTFGLGAACVGAAGCMLLLIFDVTPAVGPAYTLLAFVIVITGGLGSMPGALVGGVLIGFTEAMAGLLFTPSAKSMFAFGILVLVLLFRPQGIMGKRAT